MARRNAAVRESGGPDLAVDLEDTNRQYGDDLGRNSPKKRELAECAPANDEPGEAANDEPCEP
jgi:hypothetical protein